MRPTPVVAESSGHDPLRYLGRSRSGVLGLTCTQVGVARECLS